MRLTHVRLLVDDAPARVRPDPEIRFVHLRDPAGTSLELDQSMSTEER
jgi:hypothetical protein